VTRRADLHEAREEAIERFGLVPSDFSKQNYVASTSMTDLTEEQMREAVEMARLGAFERAIARVLGVAESSFINALKRGQKSENSQYHAFAKAFYEARKQHMKKNLAAINAATEEGDWKPAAWQLERSFGFHKQETVEVDASPAVMSLVQLAQIPLEEAEKALEVEAESVIVEDE
jgi:hypothetical protein